MVYNPESFTMGFHLRSVCRSLRFEKRLVEDGRTEIGNERAVFGVFDLKRRGGE